MGCEHRTEPPPAACINGRTNAGVVCALFLHRGPSADLCNMHPGKIDFSPPAFLSHQILLNTHHLLNHCDASLPFAVYSPS